MFSLHCKNAGKGEKEDIYYHISEKKTAQQIAGILQKLNNELVQMAS
jgi:hypothetical protein